MRTFAILALVGLVVLGVLALSGDCPSMVKSSHHQEAGQSHLMEPRAKPPDRFSVKSPPTKRGLPFQVEIERENDPDTRQLKIHQFVESVAAGDFSRILDLLVEESGTTMVELRTQLVRRWLEADPAAAASWSLGLPESQARTHIVQQVALAYTARDLPATAAWVKSLPEGPSKQAAGVSFTYEATRIQPIEALDLASGLAPTPQRDEAIVHATGQWANTDFTNAAAWALNVPDPGLRTRLVAAVAVASAEHDGAEAANFVASEMTPGPEQDRAVVSIVQRWAQQSPKEAADWISKFPDIPSREPAVHELVTTWASQDAEAAGAWVLGLPLGPLRDSGSSAYLQALGSPKMQE